MIREKCILFIKKETILSLAALAALLSAFFIPPDAAYLGYCDSRVLVLLFCLMAVMGGFRQIGAFDFLAGLFLQRAGTVRQLAAALVLLCFFSAMLVTNDVALITFVPFTILLLSRAALSEKIIPIVVLQTIAANLGSMLMPVGNPQNLYLYTVSDMGLREFFAVTLPYVGVSFVLLLGLCLFQGRVPVQSAETQRVQIRGKELLPLCLLFLLCLLAVFRILPYLPIFALVLAWFLLCQRGVLRGLDYALLLTFVFFFILIGNLGRIPLIREGLQGLLQGREVLISFLASQIISNVPAAVLLSEFTNRYDLLLAGVNIGGLGTLIASMASLISYKYYAQMPGARKGRYLLYFTLLNVLFAAILLGLSAALHRL